MEHYEMLNNDIVVKYIHESKDIQRTFETLTRGSEWKDDLYGEVILSFLEMDNDKLNSLVKQGNGSFKGYFIATVRNQLHSSSSSFYYKYRHKQEKKHITLTGEELERYIQSDDTLIDMTEETGEERLIRAWNTIQDSIYWYDRELFNIYLDHIDSKRTLMDISEKTKIPYGAVAVTLQRVKNEIKRKIMQEMNKEDRR